MSIVPIRYYLIRVLITRQAFLGVRWDFNPYAALKAEYRNEEFDNAGRENNFRLQVSFVLAKL